MLGACCGSCVGACGIGAVSKLMCAKNTRVPYYVFFVLTAIIATILRYWSALTSRFFTLPMQICDTTRCIGFGAVFRLSAALFVFFLLMALLVMCTRVSMGVDTHFWAIKLLAFVGIVVGFWFLDNQFYEVYSHIARVGAGFFLLFQVVVLIDTAFKAHEIWIERGWYTGIFIASLLLIVGFITGSVFTGVTFLNTHCTEQKVTFGIAIALAIICLVLSITDLSRHGLFPGAILVAYGAYALYSAYTSGPPECKTQAQEPAWIIISYAILALLSLTYTAYSLSSSSTSFISDREALEREDAEDGADHGHREYKSMESPLSPKASTSHVNYSGEEESSGPKPGPAAISISEELDADEIEAAESAYVKQNVYFHLVFALASCYLAMLLTSWGSVNDVEKEVAPVDTSVFSMWVKILTLFVTYGLYIFTFFAPMLFPNREFS